MSASTLLLLAPLLAAAPGDPPLVRYVAKVVTKAWEPLPIAEVERMVEAKALAELTRPGTMRLEKSGYADLAAGDYALTVDGRFIEEAESFSVYLGFGKGKREDLPSLHVSDTVPLGRLQRQEMQKRIEDLAVRAGKKLVEVLAPRLEAARLNLPSPALEDAVLPWRWGQIEVPEVASPSKAVKTLLDPRQPDHERHPALTSIASQAFDHQPIRNALERCLLTDPLPALRSRCAEALEPAARTHVPTQRVILAAMRAEVDDGVLRALTDISKAFVGLSRKEAIETWLELIASDATPAGAASGIAQLLAEEGDVANLDLAVAACLQQDALAYGKKSACAQWVLPKIPPARRLPVVIPYLKTVQVWEQGERNTYESVLEAAAGRGSEPLDPVLAEVLFELVSRPSAGHGRRGVLYLLRRHPAPNPARVEKLIALVPDPILVTDVLRTLSEWTDDHPELSVMTVGALKRLSERVRWLPVPNHENPYRALAETIERIEKRKR